MGIDTYTCGVISGKADGFWKWQRIDSCGDYHGVKSAVRISEDTESCGDNSDTESYWGLVGTNGC